MITAAESRVLNLIAEHGKAKRHPCKTSVYTWRINGEAKSGPVDTLLRKGVLQVSEDRSTATLSDKGRDILRRAA